MVCNWELFMLVLNSTTSWHQSSRGRSGSEMVIVMWYNLIQNSRSLVSCKGVC
jgi:hypothetical protein